MPIFDRDRRIARRIALALATALLAACGGGSSDFGGGGSVTPPPPAPVATVSVTAASTSIGVGQAAALVVTLADSAGHALTGRTVTYASSDTTIATVSSTGLVTGVRVGTAVITVSSEGKNATISFTITLAPVARITVSPAQQTVAAGGTVQLTATLSDANGFPVTGRTITWTISDSTRATVSSSGLVTALATVATPQVSAIAPATLVPNSTITISGANFATTGGGVSVTVAGTPVLVTSVSATQVTATIPPTFPCTASGNVPVAVANAAGTVQVTATSEGKSASASITVTSAPASAQQMLQMATQRTLAVGQALMITDPAQIGCNELTPGGSHYLVDVYNASTVSTATTAFELRGAASSLSDRAPSAARAPVRVASRTLPPPVLAPNHALSPANAFALGAWLHARDGHAQRLAYQSQLVRPLMAMLKARTRRPALDRTAAAAVAPTIPQVVGDTVTLKVQTGNSCSAFSRVVGRVVYVGTHSIILEGNDAPLAGQMDADYVKLGQVYDNVMYPILTQYFGDPMAFDDSLLHVGKVTMLFTKRVNDQATDLLGFVTPCDQFPVAYDSLVPSSNHTPMFYARVPTTQAGSSGDVNVRSVWNALIPGTLIHESKHITAVAERFADPVGDLLEESWFEEGTAQVAMELYGRTVYGPAAGWKSNATYGNTVFCDVRGGLVGSSCYGKPYVMADPFLFLNDYMLSNETKSFLSAGSEDADIYGSAWLFARWLLDQYSTQESDLLKPLVRDATMAGVDNVTDKSGHTWNELAGYFTLALAADDYPGFTPAAGARYTVPSWNLRSIYSGFATDFPTNFSPWPLGVHAISFGASTTPVGSLVGGAGAFFDLSGTQATRQLIDIHAPGGGAIPATSPLRLLILRIQ